MRLVSVRWAAIAAGATLAVGVLLGAVIYLATRPKAWDNNSIKSKFREARVIPVIDVGIGDSFIADYSDLPAGARVLPSKQVPYSVELVYDLVNSTSRDYVLSPPSGSMIAMELHSGTLVGAPGLKWTPAAGILPRQTPKDYFDPKPILIPARQTVRVSFDYEVDTFIPDELAHVDPDELPKRLAQFEVRDTDSFVLLDTANHYRIELELSKFKNAEPCVTDLIWSQQKQMLVPNPKKLNSKAPCDGDYVYDRQDGKSSSNPVKAN